MSLPLEFATIGLPVGFEQAGHDEYHGPCVFCGGEDRFVIFTDHPFPHWNCFCRKCGWKGWADQINAGLRELSPEQRLEAQRRQEAEAQARIEKRRRAMAEFSSAEIWAEMHERMSSGNREWWRKQGIPDDWQDFWRLGYTEHANIVCGGAAYTIPFFRFGFEPVNMQYRLVDPPNKKDKYRWYGLGFSSYFTARPDLGLTDEMIICEGAKKAMVVTAHLTTQMQVFAVPSKSDFAGLPEIFSGGQVYVILDPDGEAQAVELAHRIPGAVPVRLPSKIDDALNAGADWRDIERAMRYSRIEGRKP